MKSAQRVRGVDPPFLDREADLSRLLDLLGDEHVRLVTLVGPVGVGKASLARQAIDALRVAAPDTTVIEVDLPPDAEGETIVSMTLQQLGVVTGAPVSSARAKEISALLEQAAGTPILVVMCDVGEPSEGTATAFRLLLAARNIRVLATALSPLCLDGERVVAVDPFHVPGLEGARSIQDLARQPVVELFVDTVQRSNSSFSLTEANRSVIVGLSRATHGVPWAIQIMASAWAIANEEGSDQGNALPDGSGSLFDENSDTAVERAIRYSHDSMAGIERLVFTALGATGHRTSVDALARVVGDDEPSLAATRQAVLRLRERFLVHLEPGPAGERVTVRKSICDYALSRLTEEGRLESARTTLATFYLALAEEAAAKFHGPDQAAAYDRLEWKRGGVTDALRWLIQQKEANQALRLATALAEFWWDRGYISEAQFWLEESLRNTEGARDDVLAGGLLAAGRTVGFTGHSERALELLRRALAMARRCGNRTQVARALTYLGWQETSRGDSSGLELLGEALSTWKLMGPRAPRWLVASTQARMGVAQLALGNPERAAVHLKGAARTMRRAGDDRNASFVTVFTAAAELSGGKIRAAAEALQSAIDNPERQHDPYLMAHCLEVAISVTSASLPETIQATLLGARDAMSEGSRSVTQLQIVMPGLLTTAKRRRLRSGHEQEYLRGRQLSPGEAAELVRDSLRTLAEGDSDAVTRAEQLLTLREEAVLQLLAEGKPDDAIARRLGVSARTLRRVNTSLLEKLGATNRAHAVAIASETGVLGVRHDP